MTVKYRAITANCGNDVIGKNASKQIAKMIHQDDADVYVIHCQEVSFEATRRQLQQAIGEGYTVVCLGKMPTHTKLSTQFHKGTGIASFVIHKNDVDVDFQAAQAARRSKNRGGSAYNKGGLITEFTVTKNKGTAAEEKIQIQSVSGHLESNDTQKRTKDWHNINQSIAKEVTNWKDLVAACPNLRLSGYDANTRNKLTGNGQAVNLWMAPGGTNTPELQALHQVPLGGQQFSDLSTYKTELKDITTVEDEKRPGYARGGTLDFIGIADGGEPSAEITVKGVIKVPSDKKDSGRDHDVIISPLKEYELPVNDFARVKGQMAMRLERVAPDLAREIRELTDNDENKNKLIQVYQQFLSPKGLLNNAIAQHTEKLACFDRLTASSFLQDDKIKKLISETLFPASSWFEGAHVVNSAESAEQFKQKQDLMHLLLTSLNQCPSKSEVEKRIALYKEQVQKVEDKTYKAQDAIDKFKALQVSEYFSLYAELGYKLVKYEADPLYSRDFRQQGVEILMQMKAIVPDSAKVKELDPYSLSQLSRVLKYSSKAIDTLDKGGDITPITAKLTSLAHDISGKPSPGWKRLGMGLLMFACIALIVAGVLAAIPTGGSSLILAAMGAAGAGAVAGVMGMAAYEHGEERGLAKAVLDYKSAMENIVQYERPVEEGPDEDNTYGDIINNP
ncbi:hypothetical protein [Legionella maioricensis]|uniref:Uncharacterized protein n=1 Tax=Legionella maioricensis TaxID=2896528 RepID=A0A9X2I9Y3_9GAMM|nr:hypothetical protein [Legionella maioricensis]MCL9683599.1 hypothetical protein [Legionella maioricensis]MCL9687621.1 hypothetical protein [Legionella maioricensis]